MGVVIKPQIQAQEQIEDVVTIQHLDEVQQVSQEEALVDEFVKCSAEVEPYKPMIKKIEECRKSLQSIAGVYDPEGVGKVTIAGSNGASVTFKAPGDARKIVDMNGLIGVLKTKIKYPDLMELLSISLTDLDKILSPLEQAPFVSTGKGSRTLDSYTKPESK